MFGSGPWGSIIPSALAAHEASIQVAPVATSDCFSGVLSKQPASSLRLAKDWPQLPPAGDCVAVFTVVDQLTRSKETLPVALCVGINYGQEEQDPLKPRKYLGKPTGVVTDTGMIPLLCKYLNLLGKSRPELAPFSEEGGFHLIAANTSRGSLKGVGETLPPLCTKPCCSAASATGLPLQSSHALLTPANRTSWSSTAYTTPSNRLPLKLAPASHLRRPC